MNVRRLFGAAVALGMVVWSVTLAASRPPADDAARLARVNKMYAGMKAKFRGVPGVSAQDATQRLGDADVVFVDVREEGERAVSMIPGAVPADAFEADRSAYEGKQVIAYCTIGWRSGTWAAKQRDAGVDAYNLEGSLLAWTHVGGPLERDGAPTRDVHVYGATWALAHSDYRSVY